MATRKVKFNFKPKPKGRPPPAELEAEVIQISDSEEDDNASSVRVSLTASVTRVHIAEAKDAWKSLMGRMQQNQNQPVPTSKSKNKKGVKRGHVCPAGPGTQPVKKPKLSIKDAGNEVKVKILGAVALPETKWVPGTVNRVNGAEEAASGSEKAQVKPSAFTLFNADEDLSAVKGWVDEDETLISLNELGNGSGGAKASKPPKRACPFYKKIPGTTFSVDAFNYGDIPGVQVYFLSHFHSDHYIGLTKGFSQTILCDPATGNLIHMKLGVSENCIRRLELNRVYVIQGTKVVLISANHCPGSVMFIMRLPNGSTVLHTGDFRFTPNMLLNPFLKTLERIDTLYLDTTYCDPQYNFPSQTEAIAQVVEAVQRHVSHRTQTLVVCGAYCIGKERVFFSLAEALRTKVFCAPEKRRIIGQLETPKFVEAMSETEVGAQVHVLPMGNLHAKCLTEYLAHRSGTYTNLIAVKPTGWEFSSAGQGFSVKRLNSDKVTLIGVSYSEHSSFSELRDFVRVLRPSKVQPTVNVGSEPKRNAMMAHISDWLQKPSTFSL